MKNLLIAVLLLGSLAGAQQSVNSSTWSTFHVSNQISAHAVLYTTGDKLLEVWNDKGELTLTVMRDGSVSSSTQLDSSAQLFWKLFVMAYPEACRQMPVITAPTFKSEPPTIQQIEACTAERARASMAEAQQRWRPGDHLQLDANECRWKVVKKAR